MPADIPFIFARTAPPAASVTPATETLLLRSIMHVMAAGCGPTVQVIGTPASGLPLASLATTTSGAKTAVSTPLTVWLRATLCPSPPTGLNAATNGALPVGVPDPVPDAVPAAVVEPFVVPLELVAPVVPGAPVEPFVVPPFDVEVVFWAATTGVAVSRNRAVEAPNFAVMTHCPLAPKTSAELP